MKTVHTTTDPKEATLVEMALRDAGVEYRVENDHADLVIGTPSPAAAIGILVMDEDAGKAVRTISSALRRMGERPAKRRKSR